MSFNNPTPLKLGMNGTLEGRTYHIAGRVVMGVEEGGQTYYWNEFNLETAAGESATLVYEVGERGGEWRFFALFEPQYPITAEDAACKRVGDPINLDGTDVRVTLVEQSRVYFIEGKAPEGVEVGDVANYFNAQSGYDMDVVSWTGDEVECYHGVNLPANVVLTAFNIRMPDFGSLLGTPEPDSASSPKAKLLVVLVSALLLIGMAVWLYPRSGHRPPAVVTKPAPPSPLTVDSTGNLNGTAFRIQSHALVTVALVGCRFERHEYGLTSDSGDKAMLVYGSAPGAKDWVLYTPLHPAEPLTPQQAGAVKFGQVVNVDGVVAKVDQLFQSTIQRLDGPEPGALGSGDVLYCFAGKKDYHPLLVRGNARQIAFFEGTAVAEKDVTAAFKSAAR